MANHLNIESHKSSNALARERDHRILWLLEHHPATAGMLVEIGYFASRKRALRRLHRLVMKKRLKIAGTVLLSNGRPEQVYCRGKQAVKPDNVLHEVQVSRVCFKIHADGVRRGAGNVDGFLLPDAELWING